MLKLQIGTTVTIKNDLSEVEDDYFKVIEPMEQYSGKQAVITGFKTADYWDTGNVGKYVGYALDIDEGVFGWEEAMFED